MASLEHAIGVAQQAQGADGGSTGGNSSGGGGGGTSGGASPPGGSGSSGDKKWPLWGVALASLVSTAELHPCNAQQAAADQRQHWQGMSSWLAGGGEPAAGARCKAEFEPSAQAADPSLNRAGEPVCPQNAPAKQPPAAAAIPNRIVLFVEPSPFTYTSGYQTRFLATIQAMVSAGCQVLVVTPGRGAAGLLPGGEQQPTTFAGARVVEAGSFPCPGYSTVPLSLGLSPRIFNEVRFWRPDIIHVTSPGTLPIAAWMYSRILRVPLVASFHTHVPTYLPKLGLGWLEGSIWGLIHAIHRAADLTIAVSQKTAADLVEAGACDPKLVKVWPKACDCERFSPAHACWEMRRRLEGGGSRAGAGSSGSARSSDIDVSAGSNSTSSSPGGPLLLYVGRVSSEKNLELLRCVLQQVPGSRLAIVGDGPAMRHMRRHFAGTPTAFLGMLRGHQLSAAYASADIFVMPSESETLGNVVGEAMASGLPVVAAAAGGVPSVIGRPGETGILFPPGDAEAAARAIQQLMRSPEARRRMSQAARAEMERWSWRRATQQILHDHYPAAVAAAAGRPPTMRPMPAAV